MAKKELEEQLKSYEGYINDIPWEDFMAADLKALAECTHIALLEGWEESKGANTERTEALKLNLEIMYLKLFD